MTNKGQEWQACACWRSSHTTNSSKASALAETSKPPRLAKRKAKRNYRQNVEESTQFARNVAKPLNVAFEIVLTTELFGVLKMVDSLPNVEFCPIYL
jgi:hypothetical protein